jgi:hypothetical protein
MPSHLQLPPLFRVLYAFSSILILAVVIPFIALEQPINAGKWSDDARRYLFWMERWNDHLLFRDDYIADFYQAVSPPGFKGLYWLANAAGISAHSFHFVVPFIVLLVAAVATWRLSLAIGSPQWIATLATAIVCAAVLAGDHAYGTPRAAPWAYLPLFLQGLVEERPPAVTLAIVVAALFYPVLLPVIGGTLVLTTLSASRQVSSCWATWVQKTWPAQLNLALVGVCILIYALSTAHGSNFSFAEARTVSSLNPGGRNAFFPVAGSPLYEFWICNHRSGLLPGEWCHNKLYTALLMVPTALALAYGCYVFFYGAKDAVGRLVLSIAALAVVAVLCWATAHVLLFHAYLPNRYTEFVLQLLPGPSLLVAIQLLGINLGTRDSFRSSLMSLIALVIGAVLVASVKPWGFVGTSHPGLHAYLQSLRPQPLVASLESEADNIPAFGQSRILLSYEFLYAYNRDFYKASEERAKALVEALLSADPTPFERLSVRYGVTHLLISEKALASHAKIARGWLSQNFPNVAVLAGDKSGKERESLTMRLSQECTSFRSRHLILLDVQCMLHKGVRRQSQEGERP